MATICLSPVLGLRCLGLSHIQEAITLVPVGLEVVFSLGLIIAGREAGSLRYFLAAEGPTYVLLSVLSFLGHVVPVFKDNRVPFKALDIVISVTSFGPILLYTIFLYLFNRRESFPRLSKRFALVSKAFLFAVIPIIVVTGEIGSFVGIKYRQDPDPDNGTMYYIGGPGLTAHEFARELLSSTSLALLTAAQALTFLLFFVRLASGLVKQRNIEDRAATEQEGVLFRGQGWLVVGMKLSMCETALGWVAPSFGLLFTRRGIRLIGRACIVIGVVKGPERREEFIILDNENGNNFRSGTRKLRVSGLRLHISTPTLIETSMTQRFSRMTFLRPFRQSGLGPDPMPSTSRRASAVPSGTSTRTGGKRRPSPLSLRPSEDNRVTVVHNHGHAPTLVLNLSSPGLPTVDAIAAMSEKLHSRPVSMVVPQPLSNVAPLTEPLPRMHLRPPDNHASTSRIEGGRRSSDGSASHRRPFTSTVDSGKMQSRRPPQSMPSSPRGPVSFLPVLATTPPSASRRARVSEERARALQSLSRSEPDRLARNNSTASGLSTEWIASDDDDRESYIKVIGAVRPRVTPDPTRDLAVRTSIVLERLGDVVGPPAPPPSPERARLVRKDSGVLGKDDLVRVRRAKSRY
ncbi:hypothetical protein EDB92DRAFT_2119174 [Lactarius akahatsu]|uniref:Uncharacterized protein n=1 Tax=Lactarius akahatsu TaxID=416441 RepID=A0AAD4L7V8_9AGAM|nr:hypothetical protein EDB92DRAFT_2119174 [Lactarius akahatsu]